MSAISELLERVEKATGADREIDAALYNLLHTDNFRPVAFNAFVQDDPEYFDLGRYHDGWLVGKTKRDVYAEDLERFTDSLDAALALVEAKLPGWSYGVAMRGDKLRREGCDDERAYAWLKNGEQAEADAPTLALALCLALLRALEEQKP